MEEVLKTKHVKNNKQEDEFVDIINVNNSELYFEIVTSPWYRWTFNFLIVSMSGFILNSRSVNLSIRAFEHAKAARIEAFLVFGLRSIPAVFTGLGWVCIMLMKSFVFCFTSVSWEYLSYTSSSHLIFPSRLFSVLLATLLLDLYDSITSKHHWAIFWSGLLSSLHPPQLRFLFSFLFFILSKLK